MGSPFFSLRRVRAAYRCGPAGVCVKRGSRGWAVRRCGFFAALPAERGFFRVAGGDTGAAKAAESVQNKKGCDIAVKFENLPRKRLTFVKEITKIVNNLKLNKS